MSPKEPVGTCLDGVVQLEGTIGELGPPMLLGEIERLPQTLALKLRHK